MLKACRYHAHAPAEGGYTAIFFKGQEALSAFVQAYLDLHRAMLAMDMECIAFDTGMLLRQVLKAQAKPFFCRRAMHRFSICFWA